MADPAPAPVVQKVKAKKATKPKMPAAHPKYSEMVTAAIASLKERGGSSRVKILKYIMSNYKVGEEKSVNSHLKIALRNGVKTDMLKQSKGTGATGSFRLGEVAKKAPAKVKKPKKPAAKKPAAKKPATKKPSTEKPTAKKSKSPTKAKKPAAKKPKATKPANKKSPKKAAKKATPKKANVSKPTKKTPKKAAKKPAKK